MQNGLIVANGWLAERVDRGYVAVSNLAGSLWWPDSMWGQEHAARWLRNVLMYERYAGLPAHPGGGPVAERLMTMVDNGTAFADYTQHTLAAYNEEELLMGLLAWWEARADSRALQAAVLMGRSIAENHPHLAGNHYYKGLTIGRLLDLAKASNDSFFVDAAVEIADDQRLAILEQTGGSHGAVAAIMVHWYLDLYAVTETRRYLDWALQIRQAICERMFITGGLGEILNFTQPPSESDLHDETCQHAWWLLANLRYWEVTADPDGLDLAERILYNALLPAQLHRGEDGGFCAMGDVDQGHRGLHNYICCDNDGFFALLETVRRIGHWSEANRTLSVNLLLPSTTTVTGPDGAVIRLKLTSAYPVQGAAQIDCSLRQPARFTLKWRVPDGARPAGLWINGQPVDIVMADGAALIEREWRDGDRLEMTFPMAVRVQSDMAGHGPRTAAVSIDGNSVETKRIGVIQGPVVSLLLRSGHGNDISRVWTGDYPEALDSGGCSRAGYPMSKLDLIETDDGRCFDTGEPPDDTTVTTEGGLPRISWTHTLADRITIRHDVTVYPGLPVTLDWTETITGHTAADRLMCAGLRFAMIKQSTVERYGVSRFPYPFPMITTQHDLRIWNQYVAGGGSFGLADRLVDGEPLKRTGTFRICNGSFRSICHYDPEAVGELVARVTDSWAGVYMVPATAGKAVIKRRLVFCLYDQPLGQDLSRAEWLTAASDITCVPLNEPGQPPAVRLYGPVLLNTPALIPRDANLQPGDLLYDNRSASVIAAGDDDRLVVRLPVPGSYRIMEKKE